MTNTLLKRLGLSDDFKSAGYVACLGLGVVDEKNGLSELQREKVSGWLVAAKSGRKEAMERLEGGFEVLAMLEGKAWVEECLALDGISWPVDNAMARAAECGIKELVDRLLPLSDPKAKDSKALRGAAEKGHLEIVKMLIPVSDPKANASDALRNAACNGHKAIVQMLIPVSDPKAMDSWSLRVAAEKGHKDVVGMLIPVSDPSGKIWQELRGLVDDGSMKCSDETANELDKWQSAKAVAGFVEKLRSKRVETIGALSQKMI